MSRSHLLCLLGGVSLIGTITALAGEGTQPASTTNVLFWLTSSPPDYVRGVGLALLGLAGASVVVFGCISGFKIPGLGAKNVQLDADEEELKSVQKSLHDLTIAPTGKAAEIKALTVEENALRASLWKAKSFQFSIAALLYGFLGAVFAAVLAQNWIQAVGIGAAWTSLVGTFGIKNENEKRANVKDDAIKEAIARNTEVQKALDDRNVIVPGLKDKSEFEKTMQMAIKA
jgi:hypothetical protein